MTPIACAAASPLEHDVDLAARSRASGRGPAARDEVGDRAALGELHRVPRHVAAAVAVVDRHDGRVRELRGELRLAAEARDGRARRARCAGAAS